MYQFEEDTDTLLLTHSFLFYNKNFKLATAFSCAICINLENEANK